MHKRLQRNKRKWLKLFVYAIFLIFIFFIPTLIMKEKNITSKLGVINAETIDRYYVPISHFTDEPDNISSAKIKDEFTAPDREVYAGKNELGNIKKLLSITEVSEKVILVEDDKVISAIAEKSGRFALVPYSLVTPDVKSLAVDNNFLWDEPAKYALKLKVTGKKGETAFETQKVTLLTNVGDVILGRHVAAKIREYGDYNHPWLKMAAILKKGDLTFADLECPLSDSVIPPDEGMSFIVSTKAISGFKLAGIDIVGLANNHSTNFGGLPDTLDVLRKAGIKYVGGGKDAEEAYAPAYMTANGIRFAFVDFNSIIGAINADETTPGVAKFDIKPWSDTDNQSDIDRINGIIKKAKANADIVVAQFHWGVEYEPAPIQSQINVARQAIRAGADLIIGTHPHTVQGMEYFQGVPVLYSLGNFIFDQEWSIPTKQGTIAQTYFYGKKLVAIKLIPYQIEDYNQPGLATPSQKKEILERIFNNSNTKEYQ